MVTCCSISTARISITRKTVSISLPPNIHSLSSSSKTRNGYSAVRRFWSISEGKTNLFLTGPWMFISRTCGLSWVMLPSCSRPFADSAMERTGIFCLHEYSLQTGLDFYSSADLWNYGNQQLLHSIYSELPAARRRAADYQ